MGPYWLRQWFVARRHKVITCIYFDIISIGLRGILLRAISHGVLKVSICKIHYNDVIMSAMVSQIASVSNVNSTVWSGTDKCKHQSSKSLAVVRGIHRWSVNSPHKGPVTRKMFPFDDVFMHAFKIAVQSPRGKQILSRRFRKRLDKVAYWWPRYWP